MNNWNNGRLLEKIKFSKVYFIEKKRNTNLEARIGKNLLKNSSCKNFKKR